MDKINDSEQQKRMKEIEDLLKHMIQERQRFRVDFEQLESRLGFERKFGIMFILVLFLAYVMLPLVKEFFR